MTGFGALIFQSRPLHFVACFMVVSVCPITLYAVIDIGGL